VNAGTLVLGILNGLNIGLLGIGLVLVFKSNRFLNLAHAQLGALSAQLLAKLVIDDGWNWWIAFFTCVPLGIVIGLAVDRWVIRPLRERSASTASLLLVSVGVTEVLIGISAFGVTSADPAQLVRRGYPLPFGTTVRVGDVVLNGADLLVVAVVPLLVIALTSFLRWTATGKSIRAAASNPDAARLCGVSPRRVSGVVWGLAGGISAITAILQAPSQSSFDATALGPDLLLFALGAAAFGGFISISGALVGGLLIGVANQLALGITADGGIAHLIVFGLIVAIVVFRGRIIGHAFASTGAAVTERAPLRIPEAVKALPIVRWYRPLGVTVLVTIGLLLPLVPAWTSEGHRFQLSLIMVYALCAVSLTIAIGWAGQISLGQFAILGAGAFVAGHLLAAGWSLPFVLIPAGITGAVLMVLVGLPAVRVPGLTLAVTTLGLALVCPAWLFRQSWFGSDASFGIVLQPPALARGLGHPEGQIVVYYFCLVVLTGCAFGLAALRRTQAGRVIIAVRDNERAASSFSVTPATVKVAALALSGFLAGMAGVLWADAWRAVSFTQFQPTLSLAVLALPVIGGLGSITGAIVAATVFYTLTFFVAPHLTPYFGPLGGSLGFQLLLGGTGLIVTIVRTPHGLAGLAQDWWQRRLDKWAVTAPPVPDPADRPTLIVREVSHSFGGISALDDASIEVRPGEIVGLIGPNGAGKSTLLNVISGRLRPQHGAVTLGSLDLSDLPSEVRAAIGLGRTFQDAHLFPGLTVTETIQVAMAKRYRSSMLASSIGAPWVRHAEAQNMRSAHEVIDRLGLTDWSGALTGELSTGTRRICDLAAQVAARPRVLLLDEPTAGVAQREAEAFGPVLRRIRDELDCSILIVEHDMPLLMGLCDRVYAMVAGRVIASGTPEEVRADPRVIASYLGTDEVAIARSGSTATKNGAASRGAARQSVALQPDAAVAVVERPRAGRRREPLRAHRSPDGNQA
jgi:ABC-type branched-subunit amino acid transport system ATPase component/ABC-type branched-subunit amino acid transport system permease subunit